MGGGGRIFHAKCMQVFFACLDHVDLCPQAQCQENDLSAT